MKAINANTLTKCSSDLLGDAGISLGYSLLFPTSFGNGSEARGRRCTECNSQNLRLWESIRLL